MTEFSVTPGEQDPGRQLSAARGGEGAQVRPGEPSTLQGRAGSRVPVPPAGGSRVERVEGEEREEGARAQCGARRRRECLNCSRRFTTYERAQLEPLMVVKRSGVRQAFNPDKLLRGLMLATEKRPVEPKLLRAFAYSFEDDVQSAEIPAEEIGRRAMTFLRPLDDVAYIRFASVYRDFDSLERFIEEIRGLKDSPPDDQKADQKADREAEE